ncbi:MAG TPA: hypothetical protein VGE08_04715 [Steroidobacter sp.]|uniref:hypothetical protein n=1 Tax=Steroidobacter sp. TaxID=1978227 RepID=UPI002ED92D9F
MPDSKHTGCAPAFLLSVPTSAGTDTGSAEICGTDSRSRRLARQQGGQGGTLLRQNSDEAKPVRTDESVAELANVSRDTVRKVEMLQMLANHLRSVAALSPNDPELQARVNAAGTACQQLVAFLRRQGGSNGR